MRPLPLLLLPALALLVGTACGRQERWPATPPADACAAGALPAGPVVLDIEQPERRRQALVWTPPGPGPHDVVVVLHEFRSNPERQAYYSGWLPFAREAGVILVAPDGRGATWNAGDCCGKAMEVDMDDVGFLDDAVAKVEAAACTTGRVLATGIGNGGMMAERWACASDVPDAVVSVGGSLQLPTCDRERPVPVLHYHGEADRFVPLDGSPGVLEGRRPLKPLTHALERWRAVNGAPDAPERTQDGALTCTTWSGAAPITSCTVADASDSWPGAADGPVASDSPLADATRGAWAWVKAAWDAPPAADAPEPPAADTPEPPAADAHEAPAGE